MPSESVCQVARSWVDVGSFHTRLFGVVYFVISSFREFLDTPSYVLSNEYRRFLSHVQNGRGVKLTIHLLLMSTFLFVDPYLYSAMLLHKAVLN
jgi:hypothetical protein